MKHTFKNILAPLTLIFSLSSDASSADEMRYADLKCTDIKGKSVEFIEDSYENVTRAGGLFAFATIQDKKPYIVYETEYLGQMPKQFQEMLFAHECAHHRNGDLYKDHKKPSGDLNSHFETVIIPMEDAADRMAIEYLVKERHFESSDIDIITGSLEKLISMIAKKSPMSLPFIKDKPEKIKNFYEELKR